MWLRDNDKSKEASIQIENFKERLLENETNLKESTEYPRSNQKFMESNYSNKGFRSKQTFGGRSCKQTEMKELGVIESQIKHKEAEVEGNPCEVCGSQRNKPSNEKKCGC